MPTTPETIVLRVWDDAGCTKEGVRIRTAGVHVGAFAMHPVVSWLTPRWTAPIGRARRLWVEAGILYATMEFAPEAICPQAHCAAWLVFSGRVRGVSGEFASRCHRAGEYVASELVSIRLCDTPCNPASVVVTPMDPTFPKPSLKTWSLGTRLHVYDVARLEAWLVERPCEVGPGLQTAILGWAEEARKSSRV